MHVLVSVFLISVAVLMAVWGLSTLVRHAGEDSPFAAPQSPPTETYGEVEADKSSSQMTSRN